MRFVHHAPRHELRHELHHVLRACAASYAGCFVRLVQDVLCHMLGVHHALRPVLHHVLRMRHYESHMLGHVLRRCGWVVGWGATGDRFIRLS
jgi:hypothetical protein